MTQLWHLESKRKVSLFPIFLAMEALTDNIKAIVGDADAELRLVFKDGIYYWYDKEDDYNRLTAKYLELILNNPNFLKDMMIQFKSIEKQFFVLCKTFKNSANYSNEQLINFYGQYTSLYKRMYSYSCSNWIVSRKLTPYLIDYLRKILQKQKKENKLMEYFCTFITEPRAAYAMHEQISLLKIATAIQEDDQAIRLFNQNIGAIKSKLSEYKLINKMFSNHVNRFFWIGHDYENAIWTEDFFIEKLKSLVNENNLNGRLINYYKHKLELKNKVKGILLGLGVDAYHKKLFEAQRFASYLKEYRKNVHTISFYYVSLLLKELGKRYGYTLQEMRFLLSSEIGQFEKIRVSKNVIRKRAQCSISIVQRGETKIHTDVTAERLIKDTELNWKPTNELSGRCVSSGKAQGTARIILSMDDTMHVMPGDVLIMIMPLPKYINVFLKASALVLESDEGVTSHGAILAREAGIPAISGVQNATKIFKNGDIIKVDADNATIQIIKRNTI